MMVIGGMMDRSRCIQGTWPKWQRTRRGNKMVWVRSDTGFVHRKMARMAVILLRRNMLMLRFGEDLWGCYKMSSISDGLISRCILIDQKMGRIWGYHSEDKFGY